MPDSSQIIQVGRKKYLDLDFFVYGVGGKGGGVCVCVWFITHLIQMLHKPIKIKSSQEQKIKLPESE